eukprot:6585895-Alexandrium_andersonii.AAC.1
MLLHSAPGRALDAPDGLAPELWRPSESSRQLQTAPESSEELNATFGYLQRAPESSTQPRRSPGRS